MNSQVGLELSAEGSYTAFVPALPGCISEGDNKDEAIKNIQGTSKNTRLQCKIPSLAKWG